MLADDDPRAADRRSMTHGTFQSEMRIAYSEPQYPEEAKGVEGRVTLDAVIGTDGEFVSLSIHDGQSVLAAAALDAVKHWKYRPTTLNGVPVEVETQIHIDFRP